jgi:hypothetical protein
MGFLGLFLRLFWGAFFVNILLVENSALANPCVLEHARKALAKFNEDNSEATKNPRGQLKHLRNLTPEQLRQLPEDELKVYLYELIKSDPIRGGYTLKALNIQDKDLRVLAAIHILSGISDSKESIDPRAIAALRSLKSVVEEVADEPFGLLLSNFSAGDGKRLGNVYRALAIAGVDISKIAYFKVRFDRDIGDDFLFDFEAGLAPLKQHPVYSKLVNEIRGIALSRIYNYIPNNHQNLVENYLLKIVPTDKEAWIKVMQHYRLDEFKVVGKQFFSRFKPTKEDFWALIERRATLSVEEIDLYRAWFQGLEEVKKRIVYEKVIVFGNSLSNQIKFLEAIGMTKSDQINWVLKGEKRSLLLQRFYPDFSKFIAQMKSSGDWQPSHTKQLFETLANYHGSASLNNIQPLWDELGKFPPETQVNIYRHSIGLSDATFKEFIEVTGHPELVKKGIVFELKQRVIESRDFPAEELLTRLESVTGVKLIALKSFNDSLNANKNQAVFDVLKQALLKSTSDPELLKALALATHFERADVTKTLAQDTINYYLTFEKYPETLADLVSFSYGIPKEKLTAKALDRNTVTDLLDSLSGIKQFLGHQEFEQFKIPIVKLESGSSAKVLVDISDSLRALLTLESTPQTKAKTWQEILKSEGLHESKTFTDAELKALSQRLDTKIAQAAQTVFQTPELNFNNENLAALQKKWGDISFIYRLLGRFKEKAEWNSEIPALGRYLKAVLDGKFVEHKFDGLGGEEAQAAKQLAILKTPEAQKAWREERSGVRIAADDKFFDQKKATEVSIRNNIENMFVVHATETLLSRTPNVPYEKTSGALKGILIGPKDFMEAWSNWKNSAENSVYKDEASLRLLHAAGEILKSQETSLDQKIQVINRLNALSNKNEIDLSNQLKDDIKSIVSAQKTVQSQNAGTRISVTLITTDPKAMILVGDLVDQTSCQKISGDHCETLLGYVKDANVKIILSKSLVESNFQNPGQWNRVLDFLANGGALKAKWNPEDSSLTLSDAKTGGEKSFEVRTKPFEFFDRRHILKLGETKDSSVPGLIRERPYNQGTAQQPALELQALEMATQLAADIGGVYGQRVKIVGTRNPLGVYSDQARVESGVGIRKGDYEINQPDFK